MTIHTPDHPQDLTLDDLKPADVLLARGQGVVSDLIAKADGGRYSHGALWSGIGVIQATSNGITHEPFETGEFDVYRYKELDGAGAAEVVDFAKSQVSGSYAYGELVLLGLLFSCGLRVKGALLNRVLDAIGGSSATRLEAWLQEHSQQRIRVCTELVAASFFRTTKQRFALRICPFSERPAPPPVATRGAATLPEAPATEPTLVSLTEASHGCLELLTRRGLVTDENVRGTGLSLPAHAPAAATKTRKVFLDPIAFDASTGEKLGVVTPADLQFSPSLEFIGRLASG